MSRLFKRIPGRKNLVNVPFVLGLLFIIASGAHEGIGGIGPYLPLLVIFAVQLVWPTVIGWSLTLTLWIVLAFGVPAYSRFIRGVEEFNNWVLLLWGIAPAVVLWAFRPRMERKDNPPKTGPAS